MIRRHAATLLAAAFLLPAAARAQPDACAEARDAAAVEAAIHGPTDRAAVQAGLRAIFGADDGSLADGIIGPVTLSRLGELCAAIPLAEGTGPAEGAVDLARRYGALAQAAPDWRLRIADPGLTAAGPGFRRDVLRLAGSTASAAAALTGTAGAEGCGAVEADALVLTPADAADLAAGARVLAAADPALEPEAALAEVCALYPPQAGAAALADDMARLGRIEAAHPGAAAILGAPEFAAWLAEGQVPRTTRLLGTVPAVVALLAEYRGHAPVVPADDAAVAGICPETGDSDVPTYFALTPADLEALTARAGIAAALAPVAKERFDDREALVAAINTVLGVSPPGCAARLVDAAVTRHADAGTVYSLDAGKVQALALQPQLAGLLPAVAPLEDLESGSRDQLAAGLEAAIRASAGQAIGQAAGAAADAAAAVAEDVSPAPDTPAPGIPAAPPAERPAEFAITDTSLLLLEPAVEDQAFFDAITASPYNPLPSRELVRSDMLAVLEPVVAGRSDALAREGLDEILPSVRPRWRLSEEVTAELAANPVFAAVAPEVLAALGSLSGIAYPTARLFEQGLASLPVEVAGTARAAILEVAEKRVADPYVRRSIGPVAADCGCNDARRDNALVYGFFPFWQFDATDPAATPRVDFELVGRIAFDGLVLGRNAELHYAPQWNDAAATLTVSAHRHHAAIDLGIRLAGWRDWSPEEVRTAADRVIAELGKQRATDALVASSGALGWLDSYLDRRVDGVTLIAEGYTGNPATGGRADNLIALVRMISAGISGSGQEVNLAFDIPLTDEATVHDPLFQDLHGLIVDLERPEARPVARILVFLERRTTQAKKNLRLRVENSFKGEERIQVLRSIVPVLPPGANAALAQEQRAGDAIVTATTEAASYGQFRDDVVYFQDNFAGIGFWPAPAAGATLPDGSPDRLGEIVAARYYAWTPPFVPAGLRAPIRDGIDGACTLVCPNRLAFHLASAATAGLIGALLLLGLYSGRVRSVSRRFFLVPFLMLGLLTLMVIIVTCDTASRSWSPGAILAMVMLMLGSVVFHWYERRVDGPMP